MKVKSFPLYEGLFKAKRIIKEKWTQKDILFVFIAGGSASGKTSNVANKIAKFYKNDSVILSMDNYFYGAEYVKKNNITFDQPEAINIKLLHEHLEILSTGKEVLIPSYDFIESKSIANSIKIEPKKVIVVEGLFTLHEILISLSDLKLFVETSTHGRLIRRVLRDMKRTRQKVNEIVHIFETVVNPMHEKYIEPQKEISDMIILNEFDPYLELRGFDLDKFIKENNIPNI
ncbi:MAG: uridine kinase [Candidatus Gracilibacteria bacterium]|nr:uridine kinase [Candidatus Gracilibacteria bacterium]